MVRKTLLCVLPGFRWVEVSCSVALTGFPQAEPEARSISSIWSYELDQFTRETGTLVAVFYTNLSRGGTEFQSSLPDTPNGKRSLLLAADHIESRRQVVFSSYLSGKAQ